MKNRRKIKKSAINVCFIIDENRFDGAVLELFNGR